MKKLISILVLIFILFGLSSCFTSTFNPLGSEDFIIYENESKTVRLEIALSTSDIGRLYVLKDELTYSFAFMYRLVTDWIGVYINFLEDDRDFFNLEVSFESINFFKTNYDVMYLKEIDTRNVDHEILSGLDVALNRIYDQDMNPLNYFQNIWISEDNDMVFVNDDIRMYHGNAINGTIGEERVWISFTNETFTIWTDDLSVKMSGSFSFDGKNIVLEQFGWYTDFPDVINLTFMELTDA